MARTGKIAGNAAGLLALVSAMWLVSIGCGPMSMRLTEKRYPPRPASQEIDLYQGGVTTPHEEIAWIDTAGVEDLTTDTRKVLVEDLKGRARRFGADAVIDARMLVRPVRGWVRDPMTPFRSFKQGWRDQHYLRGKAIRFTPVEIETGESMAGERFQFAEGEQPKGWESQTTATQEQKIEVYETTDEQGRKGFAARLATPETQNKNDER